MTNLIAPVALLITLLANPVLAQGMDPMRDPAFNPNLTRVDNQYLSSRAMYHYLNSRQTQEIIVVGRRTGDATEMSLDDAASRGILASPDFDIFVPSRTESSGGVFLK